jgi:hypothetical protein
MKTYKAAYGISALTMFVKLVLGSVPVFFVLALALAAQEGTSFLLALAEFFGVVLIMGLCFFVLVALISLMAKAVTTNQVIVEESKIYYQGKNLVLDQIQYITLYFPVHRRFSNAPQLLSVWVSDKEKLTIVRPSLFLISALKKRCPNAKFQVDASRSDFKMVFFVGLGVTVVFLLIWIFTAMG